MAALSELTFNFKSSRIWDAKVAKTGALFDKISAPGNLTTPTITIKHSTPNATAGGGDSLASFILSLAGGATVDIDLQALTDVANRTGHSLARFKYIEFWLLGTADDATNGTACSGVTIGNAASNAHQLFLGSDTHTFTLGNGEFVIWATRSAAGKVVDGSNKAVKVLNNDGSVAAALQVTVCGGSS